MPHDDIHVIQYITHALCSELEGNLQSKAQQLSQCQLALREAQEDLARDEIIFAGKLKELHEVQSIAQQLQVIAATPIGELQKQTPMSLLCEKSIGAVPCLFVLFVYSIFCAD